MEKREELRAKVRDILGKKVRFLRRQGLTPANLYGRGMDSTPLQVETPILERLIARVGRNALIALRVDGDKKPRLAMIRDIQRHPLSGKLLHVDFFQVEVTQKVRAEVPLAFIGEPPAVKTLRGTLIRNLTSLQLEALPTDLPRSVEVDLSVLADFDQVVHVRDVTVADGVEILTDPDQVVAHVEPPRVEIAPEVEEAPAEEKKEEGETE